ncbi:meiosis-specific with OB domain-containing protein isoform X1 [Leguminivora glycinivorella]|uniref:meiosis-specific with OB domain-containing protein isoform X1 n=1 Tax=Leguminivora glycinivorella TaxID=1035111 RepID=UPI00200CEF37|nr:meiosis-specific with OB domain-containing protein isoform X1 [Leguminivora glycinivorella]
MSGVQRVRLNNLNINLKSALIVGIIIAKKKPRAVGSKKKNGDSRGVMGFVMRDSEVDTINVDVWGSEYFALTFYERFLVGDVVEISQPKICVKSGNDEYRPLVTSPFELVLNEGTSDVCIHTGDSFASFLPLLHIPSKPPSGYYGLGEVLKLPEGDNVYVDLLVVVKSVKPVKSIKTKAGVDMTLRNVEIIDNTTPASIELVIFDIDTIQRAEDWRPLESVLFISDARVSWRGRVGVQVSMRTIVTHQPHTADAEALLLYVRNQANTRGGEAAAWAAWSGERAAAASAAQVRDRLAAAAPFCASLHALCTQLDLEDLVADQNVEELRMRFADHTGELNVRLPVNILEEVLGFSAAQLKAMSADERASVRWKILLEQCTVKLAGSPSRLLVLSLRRASQADPIPLY